MHLHTIKTIVSDPALHNGQPVIAGTAIRVADLVAGYLFRGHTPETLAAEYKLPLGDVLAALAYYYQNKATFDAQRQSEADTAAAAKAQLAAAGRVITLE